MNKLDYVIYYTGQNRSSPEAEWISFRSFLQSNISILIAGNPMRSDNAWNEDHSENVYAQQSIVKLQAWDSVISIYCLCNTAVVFPLVLNTEVDVLSLSLSLSCSQVKSWAELSFLGFVSAHMQLITFISTRYLRTGCGSVSTRLSPPLWW